MCPFMSVLGLRAAPREGAGGIQESHCGACSSAQGWPVLQTRWSTTSAAHCPSIKLGTSNATGICVLWNKDISECLWKRQALRFLNLSQKNKFIVFYCTWFNKIKWFILWEYVDLTAHVLSRTIWEYFIPSAHSKPSTMNLCCAHSLQVPKQNGLSCTTNTSLNSPACSHTMISACTQRCIHCLWISCLLDIHSP